MSPLRPLRRRADAVDGPDEGPARNADATSRPTDALEATAHGLAALARTVGFWLGVVLPFLHVPLFLGLGLTETTTPALVGLWGLNAVAITVGTGHEPAGTDAESVTAGSADAGAAESDPDATAGAAD
jgi:hypothetical protein